MTEAIQRSGREVFRLAIEVCNVTEDGISFADAKLCHNATERVVPVAVLPIGPGSRTPSRRSEQD